MAHQRRARPAGSPQKPKVPWDTYKRQVLCCLYRFFECSKDQLSVIFSTIFRRELIHRGFGNDNVPYPTLDAQWNWLRREKRPVWHHVHTETEFRTDREWKEIIHLVHITAFELGILVREKHNDTIVASDGDDLDVNVNPCEYLSSVLLAGSSANQHPTSADTFMSSSMGELASSSTEFTGGLPADASGDTRMEANEDYLEDYPEDLSEDFPEDYPPDCTENRPEDAPSNDLELLMGEVVGIASEDIHTTSSRASMHLIQGMSPDAAPSNVSYYPQDLTTEISHMQPRRFLDDSPNMSTIQNPHTNSSPATGPHTVDGSSQHFEPLVISHGKSCFWCWKEGFKEGFKEGIDFCVSASTAEHKDPAIDLPTQDSYDEVESVRDLPGLCHADNLPPLLYRWHSADSQGINTESLFVAGWFTTTFPNISSPSQIAEKDFLDLFTAHGKRMHVPTPFISAFARPLAPIHRALRKGGNAKVSIIDPRKIQSHVFHAQTLAQITAAAVDRWKGYGEYAVWGCIPNEAIISTFVIGTLECTASRDLEIGEFLQLSKIRSQETCHRGLRRDLRTNLLTKSYDGSLAMLKRLAQCLGVPEHYHEYFATDVYIAWTMDLGDTHRDEELSEENPMHQEFHNSPEPATPTEDVLMHQEAHRVRRGHSESTVSYVPPESHDGSCSESTSEEEDSKSQSPEAPCPRRDTPSPDFSVRSDTDSDHAPSPQREHSLGPTDVEMTEVAVPATPTVTSRFFGGSSNVVPPTPSLSFGELSLATPLNDHNCFSGEVDWPSEGETLALTTNDTPTKSRYFSKDAKGKKTAKPTVSRSGLQRQEATWISDDELDEA